MFHFSFVRAWGNSIMLISLRSIISKETVTWWRIAIFLDGWQRHLNAWTHHAYLLGQTLTAPGRCWAVIEQAICCNSHGAAPSFNFNRYGRQGLVLMTTTSDRNTTLHNKWSLLGSVRFELDSTLGLCSQSMEPMCLREIEHWSRLHARGLLQPEAKCV